MYNTKLSKEAIRRILNDNDIVVTGNETHDELKAILSLNIENEVIDEIDVIMEESGE